MLSLVPISVLARRRGLVRDPANRGMTFRTKWIAPPQIDMAKVDRCIEVLTNFKARWVRQSRKARKAYRIRDREERMRLEPNWGDIMFEHEQRQALRPYVCPEDEWHAICRDIIAQHKRQSEDILPALRWMQKVDVDRKARQAEKVAKEIVEQQNVWAELNAAPRLHNSQPSARIRVARGFAALESSDSE
jgi:hypothetical protein